MSTNIEVGRSKAVEKLGAKMLKALAALRHVRHSGRLDLDGERAFEALADQLANVESYNQRIRQINREAYDLAHAALADEPSVNWVHT